MNEDVSFVVVLIMNFKVEQNDPPWSFPSRERQKEEDEELEGQIVAPKCPMRR